MKEYKYDVVCSVDLTKFSPALCKTLSNVNDIMEQSGLNERLSVPPRECVLWVMTLDKELDETVRTKFEQVIRNKLKKYDGITFVRLRKHEDSDETG